MGSAKCLLSVLLTVSLAAIGLGAEEPFQPDPAVVAEVESILAKFESSLATRGAGTAVTTRQSFFRKSQGDPESTYHQFQFTPSSSRTDIYGLKTPDNPAGRRLETRVRAPGSLFYVSWTTGPDPSLSHVGLNPSNWDPRSGPMATVDFDTMALLSNRARVSADGIRSALAALPCTVTKDASGVATVRFDFTSGGFAQYKFDTNAGHTLVESEREYVFPEVGVNRGTSSKIDYSEAEGVWYPVRIYSETTQTMTRDDSSTLLYKHVTRVEITAFDAYAAIADSDFTLDGVGVQKGTRVYDQAADIDYRYGIALGLAPDIDDMLDEIEPDLTAEAVEWQSAADVASPAAVPQEDASAPPSQKHITQKPDDAAHTGPPLHRFMAAAVVAAIAIISFVVLRRRNN